MMRAVTREVTREVMTDRASSPKLFSGILPLCHRRLLPARIGRAASAFWAASYGGRTLSLEHIQKKLVEYFAGRGEALQELATDVDVDHVESWRAEWDAIAKSAGIDDPADSLRVLT